MKYLKFIDKNKSANLHHGIEFYAVGLVTVDYKPSGSGKDYLVSYIDPFGSLCHEWRAKDEITVSEISMGDYKHLQNCYLAISETQ